MSRGGNAIRHPRVEPGMTRSLLLALLAALALLAGACADSGTATGGPAESPSPTPEETATPTETESTPEGPLAELEAARERWAAAGLEDYTYRLERICFCPEQVRGPFIVTVTGGEVTDFRLEDPSLGEPDAVDELGTIEQLHDLIEAILTDPDHPDATVTGGEYDELGLPRQLALDPLPDAIDDEVTFTAELLDEAPPTASETPGEGSGIAYQCTGAPFTLDAVEGPGGPLELPEPAGPEVEQLAGNPDLPADGWHRTTDDGEHVDWVWLDPTGAEPAIGISLQLGDDGTWELQAANFDCGPFLVTQDSIAEWWVADPAGVTPDSTEIEVLLTERACAGGQPATDRLLPPQIVVEEDRVLVAWTVTPVEGAATCQSNPPTPATLTLDEPLGDRVLLDASTWPPRDALTPPDDQI